MSLTSASTPLAARADAERESAAANALVDAWCRHDHAAAFLAADHAIIESTRALRRLLAESVLAAAPEPQASVIPRDLVHAFGAIGRAIADGGGSPTLAAVTIDGLVAALRDTTKLPVDTAFATAARGAMVESYVHSTRRALEDDARRAWEYPACAVPLADGTVAIAAGHPLEDDEALGAWASRAASALALAGVRRVVVTGPEAAVAALRDALDVAGVAVTERRFAADQRARGGRR